MGGSQGLGRGSVLWERGRSLPLPAPGCPAGAGAFPRSLLCGLVRLGRGRWAGPARSAPHRPGGPPSECVTVEVTGARRGPPCGPAHRSPRVMRPLREPPRNSPYPQAPGRGDGGWPGMRPAAGKAWGTATRPWVLGLGPWGAGAQEPLTLVVEPLDLSDGLDAGRPPEQALGAEPCERDSLLHPRPAHWTPAPCGCWGPLQAALPTTYCPAFLQSSLSTPPFPHSPRAPGHPSREGGWKGRHWVSRAVGCGSAPPPGCRRASGTRVACARRRGLRPGFPLFPPVSRAEGPAASHPLHMVYVQG